MNETYRIHVGIPAAADLAAVNAVVEAAVMSWDLSDRVKRLALPAYRYDRSDLDHLGFALAHAADGRVIGVAAWEPAQPADCPDGRRGTLLHGLYVEPPRQRAGIGRGLLQAAAQAAAAAGSDGLLVKAQRNACGFFEKQGLHRLDASDARRHYDRRYWMPVTGG